MPKAHQSSYGRENQKVWRAILPKSQETHQQYNLLQATFQGMGLQDLNRAAAEYCRDTFGVCV